MGLSSLNEADFGTRSAKGEWTPDRRADYGPLFSWPTRPLAIAKWFGGFPGYLWPWNSLYLVVTVVIYWLATPAASSMRVLRVSWIVAILSRNLALTVLWFGLWDLVLYRRRRQGTSFKYNVRWPRTSDRFLFASQTRENVFWSLASGVPIWTAYEVLSHWLFATGRVTWLSWTSNPVWFVAVFLLTPIWRELHFYSTHRLIHSAALYKTVHALHHRNTNPSPWSGLSMHPLEHLLYFSSVAIHWLAVSHPIHAMYNLVHLAMAPVPGHSGFDRVSLGASTSVPTGCLNHYLHHKYFEVNYSDGAIPFDRWFGSFHDGSPEAHQRMKVRLAARNVASE